MKYYLAIDNLRSNDEDKKSRFKIIDIPETSLKDICAFTGKFKNENELLTYLHAEGKINSNDAQNKHLCICYLGKRSTNSIRAYKKIGDGLLFNHNDLLLNSDTFKYELLGNELCIPETIDINNISPDEKIKFNILNQMVKFLESSSQYTYYPDIFEASVKSIKAYLKEIEFNHTVDPQLFYEPMKNIIFFLSKSKRENKENGKFYVDNIPEMFKFLSFYCPTKDSIIKIETQNKLTEIKEEKKQLLISESLALSSKEIKNAKKMKYEQTKLF